MEGTNSLSALINSVPTLFSLVGTVVEQIVSNPILTFFASIPIVGVGVSVLRKLVGASGSI